MRVYLAQLMCANRHCIVAVPGEYENDQDAAALDQMVRDGFKAGGFDPWCGICRSRSLHVEIGATQWASLAEAMPYMKAAEAAQLATRVW